jgi:uncharacterized protein TIGR03905
MHHTYRTRGTCSVQIDFDIDDEDRVHNVSFLGGCNGNLKGIGILTEGMKREDIIEKLSGVRCGFKNTSCPDQLANALKNTK